LPGLDRHRLEVEGDVTVGGARLSLNIESGAGGLRIDWRSAPRHHAESAARLRQHRSGTMRLSWLPYQFGSIFNTIVNRSSGSKEWRSAGCWECAGAG
jgi:hypothetical protein